MGDSCEHTAEFGYDWPCQDCVVLTPEQLERGERLRSAMFTFAGTRDGWHNGQTVGETLREVREAAKKGDIEPVYSGPKSRWV